MKVNFYFKKILFSFFIILIFLNIGCYNIRKKFVRKKKYQREPTVYIDFKDYPTRPSKEVYIDYYLFVRGWLEELVETLKMGLSFKREKRAINEALKNMEQMFSFFSSEGKEKIYSFYEELSRIKEEIARRPNKSETERNYFIQNIEHFKRKFEKDFNYIDAQKWMID